MPVTDVGLERLRDTELTLADGERDIRGDRVVDADGEELGSVSALFVDTEEPA